MNFDTLDFSPNFDLKVQDKSPCDSCPNNPKNGGSGICLCTLGMPEIYC